MVENEIPNIINSYITFFFFRNHGFQAKKKGIRKKMRKISCFFVVLFSF